MICIIHNSLVLLKITRTLKYLLRSIIDFYFLKNSLFFSQHILIENPRFEKENIIKDERNLFRLKKLKKETIDTTIKDLKSLFRLEKENKAITNKILSHFRNLFQNKEGENYYKLISVSTFWSNNYIEYESNGDKNKALSAEVHLNKIRPYLRDIINNLKKSDT